MIVSKYLQYYFLATADRCGYATNNAPRIDLQLPNNQRGITIAICLQGVLETLHHQSNHNVAFLLTETCGSADDHLHCIKLRHPNRIDITQDIS